MARTVTINLREPIEHDGMVIAEVTVRSPKVRDLRAIDVEAGKDATEFDKGIVMASLLTGIPVEAVEEMGASDFAAVSEAVAGFMQAGAAPSSGAA
ncbi:phage tail assembly protein [Aquibium sp. ELW1220]|uniref:phage tail assembly protein n=1 Tax=Aquibium sp. ELW1220 TaxID=2976766 RepID=UPI0025B2369E|nr:phage tail assembly protein [Aquibium sp. ELW1220]MDN2578952.1 phage tail assembly protein [Aquibium sp. ELW1220]